jgi:nitrate reductase NapE component
MTSLSNPSASSYGEGRVAREDHTPRSSETKPSFKTTELIVFVVVALGVIITAAVVGNGAGGGTDHFDAFQAAQLLTFLSIGYMIARGLAKSGSRQPRD